VRTPVVGDFMEYQLPINAERIVWISCMEIR